MTTIIKSDLLTATINDKGAELTSLKGPDGTEYLWQAKKEVWPRHAPVLFPIVGRLKNNKYFYEGNEYELGQHGFARDMKFHRETASGNSCSYRLSSSDETLKNYPFEFILQISYTLTGNTLQTEYIVHNPAAHTLIASIGAHPGFRCPLGQDENYDDYYLEFERDTLMQTPLENGLRAGKTHELKLKSRKLKLTTELFDNDALVFENSQINTVSLKSVRSSRSVKLNCKGWPYFGVWAKKGNHEFICLEPWYGITDNANTTGELPHKDGMHFIEGGEDFKCAFSVTLS
jgi:galactose mutarotase-like enzyme